MSDFKDNGYKSRKMVMAYVVMALGTVGFFAAGKWHGLVPVYPEYCMFLIGASGVYVGGNAAAKWVAARSGKKATSEAQE